MSTFVRASKFRHVYSDPPRLDATYQNLRLSTATGEQNYIKANGLFFATGLSVSFLSDCEIFLFLCLSQHPLQNFFDAAVSHTSLILYTGNLIVMLFHQYIKPIL